MIHCGRPSSVWRKRTPRSKTKLTAKRFIALRLFASAGNEAGVCKQRLQDFVVTHPITTKRRHLQDVLKKKTESTTHDWELISRMHVDPRKRSIDAGNVWNRFRGGTVFAASWNRFRGEAPSAKTVPRGP